VWRSFELDPNAGPSTDTPAAERLAAKYGMSVDDATASHERLTGLAAADGLEYHLDRTRGGDPVHAQPLSQPGEGHRGQDTVEERLMRAYFTDNVAIDDHETLIGLAADAGLDADEARTVLASDEYADGVREDEELARRIGISGVPFFVLGRRYGVSGAQES